MQRKDGEGWEEIAGQPFRIACCDCGLVHDIVVVRGKGNKLGVAAKRNNRATAQRRRRIRDRDTTRSHTEHSLDATVRQIAHRVMLHAAKRSGVMMNQYTIEDIIREEMPPLVNENVRLRDHVETLTRLLRESAKSNGWPHPLEIDAALNKSQDILSNVIGDTRAYNAPSPLFALLWHEEYDDYDNSIYEAASPYHDDGAPFYFRIRQRLRDNKHEFYEASDAEVMMDDEDPRTWATLDEAKAAMQTDADDIVRKYSGANEA